MVAVWRNAVAFSLVFISTHLTRDGTAKETSTRRNERSCFPDIVDGLSFSSHRFMGISKSAIITSSVTIVQRT